MGVTEIAGEYCAFSSMSVPEPHPVGTALEAWTKLRARALQL